MPTLRDVRLFAKHHLVRRVYAGPERDGDLGVVSLGYTPEAYAETLRESARDFDLEVAAELPFRDARHPVFDVRSRNAGASARLLVLAGVHGNEQAGILAVPEILEAFAHERPANVALRVLTPVNPIGAAERSRFNGQGYDINRDFVHFETPEGRLVRRVVTAFRPTFVIALHEGPQDATFMFTNPEVAPALAHRVLDVVAAKGTVLATKDYFGRTLSPAGLAPPTRTTRMLVALWARVLGMKTTNAYASDLGVPEITLESSWKGSDRSARLRAHRDLVLAVAHELANAR